MVVSAPCRPLKEMEVLKRKAQEEMGGMLQRQEERIGPMGHLKAFQSL